MKTVKTLSLRNSKPFKMTKRKMNQMEREVAEQIYNSEMMIDQKEMAEYEKATQTQSA